MTNPLKPGEVDLSGNIQSPDPAAAYAAGLVIIKREQLQAALKHGWEEVPADHIKPGTWVDIATDVYLDPGADRGLLDLSDNQPEEYVPLA